MLSDTSLRTAREALKAEPLARKQASYPGWGARPKPSAAELARTERDIRATRDALLEIEHEQIKRGKGL
jgi:hypothetical protein